MWEEVEREIGNERDSREEKRDKGNTEVEKKKNKHNFR